MHFYMILLFLLLCVHIVQIPLILSELCQYHNAKSNGDIGDSNINSSFVWSGVHFESLIAALSRFLTFFFNL